MNATDADIPTAESYAALCRVRERYFALEERERGLSRTWRALRDESSELRLAWEAYLRDIKRHDAIILEWRLARKN